MSDAVAPANNFNLIRLLAAWLVLFSHSYHLTGWGRDEPLMLLSGGRMTLGTVAVGVFFAISGYLITSSAYARPGLGNFLQARARRIFPALILVVLLTALVLGPCVSMLSAGEYFGSPAVWTYVLRNITLLRLQYDLPGVFGGNVFGAAVNGSLWTLPIEFALYLAVGGAVWALRRLGLASNRWLPLLAISAVCAASWNLVLLGSKSGAALLVPYFMLGAAARIARQRLPLHGGASAALLGGAALALALGWGGYPVAACLAISYCTLWFARHPRWVVPFNTTRLGDLSYGIYLFAFPIQQSLVAWGGTSRPLLVCLLASLLTLPCAWLTWHLLEQHCVQGAPVPLAAASGARR